MASLQQRIIAEIIEESLPRYCDWFQSSEEICDEVQKNIRVLRHGENVVVSPDGWRRIFKAESLEDLAAVEETAIVIPYAKLDEAFHERIRY